MKTIRCFMALAAFALLMPNITFADSGLPQERRDAINAKNTPTRIINTIDPEQQAQIARDAGKEACLATSNSIGGVGLNMTEDQLNRMFACCEKPTAERVLCLQQIQAEVQEQRNAAPKKEKKPQKKPLTEAQKAAERLRKQCESEGGDRATCSDPDSARFFVNRKLCQQYGGGDKCETPDGARQFVLDYRSKKKGEDAAKKLGLAPAPAPEAPPPAPSGMPPDSGYSYGTPATPAPPTTQPTYTPPEARGWNHLGLFGRGMTDGSYGACLHGETYYGPVALGGNVCWIHLQNDQLRSVGNYTGLERTGLGFDLSWMFLDARWASFSFGGGYDWIGRLGASKPYTAQVVSGLLRANIPVRYGQVFLTLHVGSNLEKRGGTQLEPPNGAMKSGGVALIDAGWRF